MESVPTPLPGELWRLQGGLSIYTDTVRVDALYADCYGAPCVAYSIHVPDAFIGTGRSADTVAHFTRVFTRRD